MQQDFYCTYLEENMIRYDKTVTKLLESKNAEEEKKTQKKNRILYSASILASNSIAR